MSSKIKSVTVVSQLESIMYQVGVEYHGLLIDKIEDRTVEYQGAITTIFMGFTSDGDTVFEVSNAPVYVGYEKAE